MRPGPRCGCPAGRAGRAPLLFEEVEEIRAAWDRLLLLAERYRDRLERLREEERARPEPSARRLRTLEVAIREADDLARVVDDVAGDRLLRVQDRQVILQKIPFQPPAAAPDAAPDAQPAGGEGPEAAS